MIVSRWGKEDISLMYLLGRNKYTDVCAIKDTDTAESKPNSRGRGYSTDLGLEDVNSSTERFLKKIYQMELPLGMYTFIDKGDIKLVESQCLVVYFIINPRCSLNVFNNFTHACSDAMVARLTADPDKTNPANNFQFNKLTSLLKKKIHTANYKKLFFELDVDSKNPAILMLVRNIIADVKQYIILYIETRGGYHIIFDAVTIPGVLKGTVVQEAKKITIDGKSVVEFKRDPAPPVPGTIQGGFRVRIVDDLPQPADQSSQ